MLVCELLEAVSLAWLQYVQHFYCTASVDSSDIHIRPSVNCLYVPCCFQVVITSAKEVLFSPVSVGWYIHTVHGTTTTALVE